MKKICSLAMLFLIGFNLIFSVRAEAAVSSEKTAVVLLIDNSGSMADTDPQKRRITASRMVMDLLGEEDLIGVKTFSTEVSDRLGMTSPGTEAFKKAKETLTGIPGAGGYTDYLKALESARSDLENITENAVSKVIILLTDGEPEVSGDAAAANKYKDDLIKKVKELGDNGISVHTVGFGTSDNQLLKQISDMTRGSSIKGESKDVVVSFFNIFRQLKNRDSILSRKTEGKDINIPVTADSGTERMMILMQDDKLGNAGVVTDENGKTIEPVYTEAGVKLYSIQSPDKETKYSITGNWNGSLDVVRDTKLKLIFEEPVNNSQLPFESEISARIKLLGEADEKAKLEVKLLSNGSDLNKKLKIENTEDGYSVDIGKMPQTGKYTIEASLVKEGKILARSSADFEVKNIPIVEVNFDDDRETMIEGVEKTIAATLTLNGVTVSSGIKDLRMILEMESGDLKKSVELFDDGKKESGDLVAGDGIYSNILKDLKAGDYNLTVNARGKYQEEDFFTGSSKVKKTVSAKGIINISLDESANVQDDKAVLNALIVNNSSYDERLRFFLNGIEMPEFETLLSPGEKENKKIIVRVGSDDKNATIDFKAEQPVTTVKLTINVVGLNRIKSPLVYVNYIVLGTGVLITALLLGLIISKRKVRLKKPSFKGKLEFYKKGSESPRVFMLKGNDPIEFTIGRAPDQEKHINAGNNTPYSITVIPMNLANEEGTIEIRCKAPGLFKKGETYSTSSMLVNQDETTTSGIVIKYVTDEKTAKGNDVLKGRL